MFFSIQNIQHKAEMVHCLTMSLISHLFMYFKNEIIYTKNTMMRNK